MQCEACLAPVEESGGGQAPTSEPDEASQARTQKVPLKPTAREIELHNKTHLPYRDWCNYCVRGRGRAFMHLRLTHDDEQCECLEIDYGFLGDPEAAATEMPILVGRTRK